MKQHICWCCIYIYTFKNKSHCCCLHFKFALCWRWIEQRPNNLPLKYPLPMHSSTVQRAALHAATTIKTNKLLWTEFALFWSPEVPQTQKCSLVVVEQSRGEEPQAPRFPPPAGAWTRCAGCRDDWWDSQTLNRSRTPASAERRHCTASITPRIEPNLFIATQTPECFRACPYWGYVTKV